MASSITLYDDAGNPVVIDGEAMKGGGGLGFGQTWQDVTASRALNTDYINDTGKPIQVAVSIEPVTNEWFGLTVNGVELASHKAPESNTHRTAIEGYIIPVGDTYSVNVSSTGSLIRWNELRGD